MTVSIELPEVGVWGATLAAEQFTIATYTDHTFIVASTR